MNKVSEFPNSPALTELRERAFSSLDEAHEKGEITNFFAVFTDAQGYTHHYVGVDVASTAALEAIFGRLERLKINISQKATELREQERDS